MASILGYLVKGAEAAQRVTRRYGAPDISRARGVSGRAYVGSVPKPKRAPVPPKSKRVPAAQHLRKQRRTTGRARAGVKNRILTEKVTKASILPFVPLVQGVHSLVKPATPEMKAKGLRGSPVGNLLEDARQIAVEGIPGAYNMVRDLQAGKEGKVARQLWGGLKQSAVYKAGSGVGHLAKGEMGAARRDFQKAGVEAYNHPGYTAADIGGVSSIVSKAVTIPTRAAVRSSMRGTARTTEKKVRAGLKVATPKPAGPTGKELAQRHAAVAKEAGRRTVEHRLSRLDKEHPRRADVARAALRVRRPVRVEGTELVKPQRPSRSVIVGLRQQRRDRGRMRPGDKMPVVRPTGGDLLRATHLGEVERRMHREVDVREARANVSSRVKRAEATKAVDAALGGRKGLYLSGKRRENKLRDDMLAFIGQGIVRTAPREGKTVRELAEGDLRAYVAKVAENTGGRYAPAATTAARLLRHPELFDDPEIEAAWLRVKERQILQEEKVFHLPGRDREQFERAALIPGMQLHLGAKLRSADVHPDAGLGGDVWKLPVERHPELKGKEGAKTREKMREKDIDVDEQGTIWETPSTPEVQRLLKEKGVKHPPIFYPHIRPDRSVAGMFGKGPRTQLVSTPKKRKGSALLTGQMRTDRDVLQAQAANLLQAQTNFGFIRDVIHDFAVIGDDGATRFFKSRAAAARAAAQMSEGGVRMTALRMADFERPDVVGDMQKMVARHDAPENMRDLLGNTLHESLKSKEGGRWVVVPSAVVKRLEGHLLRGTPGRLMDVALSMFKGTVLPFSPRWIVANLGTNLAMAVLAGVGPLDYVRSLRMMRYLRKNDPELAQKIETDILQGMMAGEGRSIRGGSVFEGSPVLGQVSKAWQALNRTPGVGHVIKGARRSSEAGFRANEWLEMQPRIAYLGKLMRKDAAGYDFGNRWLQGVARTDQLTRDMAKGMRNPLTRDALTRDLVEMLGDYQTFTPLERKLARRVVPFWSWFRFATRVTLFTLPARHPLKVALLAQLSKLAPEDAELAGVIPDFFRGNINIGGKSWNMKQISPLRSSLLIMPAKEWPSTLNPLVTDIGSFVTGRDLAMGLEPFTDPSAVSSFGGPYVKDQPGRAKQGTLTMNGSIALNLLLDKFPPLRIAKQIRERGPAWDTSTLAKPQPRIYKDAELNVKLRREVAELLLSFVMPVRPAIDQGYIDKKIEDAEAAAKMIEKQEALQSRGAAPAPARGGSWVKPGAPAPAGGGSWAKPGAPRGLNP